VWRFEGDINKGKERLCVSLNFPYGQLKSKYSLLTISVPRDDESLLWCLALFRLPLFLLISCLYSV